MCVRMSGVLDVLQGDCLQVLPTLADNSVDLVLTDPPYFKVKGDAWDRQWDKPTEFLLWLDAVVEQLARVLKPNGSLYLFASPQMAARVECQIAVRLNVLNSIVWRKDRGRWNGAGKESLRGYFPQTERIIFAEQYGSDSIAMGGAGYDSKCDEAARDVFGHYITAIRKLHGLTMADLTGAVGAHGAVNHGGACSNWERGYNVPTLEHYQKLQVTYPGCFDKEYEALRQEYEALRLEYEALRRPFAVTADVPYTDVWDFPTVQAYPGKHPCEKPQALLRHIIAASSKPGAVVLDAFAGTGSTGMACKALGRQFIGIEMSEQYAETARARIAATDAQADMFQSVGNAA